MIGVQRVSSVVTEHTFYATVGLDVCAMAPGLRIGMPVLGPRFRSDLVVAVRQQHAFKVEVRAQFLDQRVVRIKAGRDAFLAPLLGRSVRFGGNMVLLGLSLGQKRA